MFYKNIKEKTHKSKKQSRAEQGKTRANTDSNTNKNWIITVNNNNYDVKNMVGVKNN